MDESELVVVCHCEKHPQLYTIKNNDLDKAIDNKKVSFVDPTVCRESTWLKIESKSKQYVWAYNCPIGPVLMNTDFNRDIIWTEIFLDILNNSKRVLKPGGHFISGIGNTVNIDDVSLEKFINVPELTDWKIKMVKASDFTFNLGKSLTDFKRNLMVFTKAVEGGKRNKKRKTRRRK